MTPPFSAPGLVLGLLFLSTPAMGSCLDNYQELLGQLQKQADFMQHTSMLLDPYVSAWPLVASEFQRIVGLGQQ